MWKPICLCDAHLGCPEHASARSCPLCLCRGLRHVAWGSHRHCLGCSAGSTWDGSWDGRPESFAHRGYIPVSRWSPQRRPSECFSLPGRRRAETKANDLSHHRGANLAPSALPFCGHSGAGLQGGHPQWEAKPRLWVTHSRAGTALVVSALAFLVDCPKGFVLQKTSLILSLIFSCENNPVALHSRQTTHACAFCPGIKKTWPVCQSWAFDCMIDYQPPNWIHEDSSPALWPEFQKYIHKGVTFKDVSMTLWCFSQ